MSPALWCTAAAWLACATLGHAHARAHSRDPYSCPSAPNGAAAGDDIGPRARFGTFVGAGAGRRANATATATATATANANAALDMALATPLARLRSEFEDGESLKWINGPVIPANSTNPYANARYLYSRMASLRPAGQRAPAAPSAPSGRLRFPVVGTDRYSPFDLEVVVWDASNRTIQNRKDVREFIGSVLDVVYFWNATAWRQQLLQLGFNQTDVSDIPRTKSNFFWELLSEQIAERVFSAATTRLVYLYGPTCFQDPGTMVCGTAGVADAARIAVKTTIHGERDDLMPVSRTIYLFARRGAPTTGLAAGVGLGFDVYNVLYRVGVPGVTRVASPYREVLDDRPAVGGRLLNRTVELLAVSPGGRKMYPDYNLLFIPLRHLVFQGSVPTPRLPGSNMSYSTLADLNASVAAVIGGMRDAGARPRLVARIVPFFTDRYYYMFNSMGFVWGNETGVPAYRKAATIQLQTGFCGSLQDVEMHLE